MRRRRAFGRQRGQAIIEFVMVFPLMALLLFAVVDFGMAIYQRHVITTAVSDAATAGARNPTANDVSVWTDAKDFSNDLLSDADLVNVVVPCGVNQEVVVEVSHQYNLISPLQGLLNFTSGGSGPSLDIDLGAKAITPRSVPC